MNRILPALLISSILLLTAFTAFKQRSNALNPTTPGNPARTKFDISVVSQNVHEITPTLYGVDATNLYDEIQSPYDTAFLNGVKQIAPGVIRWPGGIASNFVHPMESGYGYSKSEIDGVNIRMSLKFADQGRYVKQSYAQHPYLQDLVSLAKASHSKVLLVINVTTGRVEEWVDAINYLKESGVEIAGAELGDELYLPSMRILFPFPGSYINKASQYSVILRRYFPDLKLSACAAPYGRMGDEGTPNSVTKAFYLSWNDAVAKNKFYDAVSIHYYLSLGIKTDVSIDSVFATARNEMVKTYSQTGILTQAMKYYITQFPKTKIWLSEWNIAPTETQGFYSNTLLNAVFMNSFFNYMNGFNAVNDNVFEIANFESLATGGVISNTGLISARGEKEKLSSSLVKRTSYFGFENFRDFYRGYSFPMKVISPVPHNMGIYSYKDTCTNTMWLYWYNLSGKESAIDNLIVDNDTIKGTKLIYVNQMAGTPWSSYGFTKFSRSNVNQAPVATNKKIALSDFYIPENGYGYCRIDSVK